ncbi:MAG: hypothetical protein GWO16_02955 [Gammaproteobacteria bacterium]|nr:hypothetical protein [Gammaproteobacteria bacterium]NIR97083.1 hypothetical protein [Gammaproteobacteria bacterium]NIT62785.1 hypothetical protein [Gammaproteobacteria bacterium]NIV19748.1 hypothetical protein [Gammaproteobacteria bacterium]NIX11172.1 hypothetical protein [Gammaproteobacteria bacterium]
MPGCLHSNIASLLLLAAPWSSVASIAAGPQPPCDADPYPPYAAVDAQPNVEVWVPEELASWNPPPCAGWGSRESTVLVALAARFEHRRGVDALLQRIAAVSQFHTIQYWSVTRQRWRELIKQARALTDPDKDARRGDFSVAELRSGKELYFWQDENTPAGEIIYRMRVREATAERLVVTAENVYEQRFLFSTLFGPGEYQVVHFLYRESRDIWRYYGLMRAAEVPISLLGKSQESSYINRAVAIFRYIASIPTDREPPVAPDR